MLRDQIFQHPGSLVAGCAIWVPIAIWVIALVQWAVQGDVDFLSALAGILIGIGLGMTALLSKDPVMAPLILSGVLITMVVFPFARRALNKRALEQIDIDTIERAYEMLREKPGNAPSKFRLAKAIYHKGLPGHALKLAEDALLDMPQSAFLEEHRIVKTWRHYKMSSAQFQPLACLQCGKPNRPGLFLCESCGAPFLLEHARGAWVGPAMARKFVAAWSGIIVALVGIPLAARSLPPAAAIAVIVGLMVLAIVILIFSFRPQRTATR